MPTPALTCPFCGYGYFAEPAKDVVDSHLARFRRPAFDMLEQIQEEFWIVVCPGCKTPALYRREMHSVPGEVWPAPQPKQTDKRVPELVRAALDEAKRCATVNAPNAVAVMAGRSLEEACRLLGAKGNNLASMIDDLHGRGEINNALHRAAHAVRFVRNNGAHADEPVSTNDAAAVLRLADRFVELFIDEDVAADLIRKS